jgi:hypothetical protein
VIELSKSGPDLTATLHECLEVSVRRRPCPGEPEADLVFVTKRGPRSEGRAPVSRLQVLGLTLADVRALRHALGEVTASVGGPEAEHVERLCRRILLVVGACPHRAAEVAAALAGLPPLLARIAGREGHGAGPATPPSSP